MSQAENKRVHPIKIHESVFVAEGARIYGDVRIAEGASIWFNAVLRADEGPIEIGVDTNIQDNAVIHSDLDAAVIIAGRVTIGHGAVIRACRIGADAMIGMNATVMSGADIGEQSIVGANAFIPYNQSFAPQSLIVGSPARVVRQLTDQELTFNRLAIDTYKDLVRKYRSGEITGISG
ncbi:MAG: gamma carbonic anhydrase family protein [Thermodesulfobacteriota bacterium]|nr:gamma carbonic anhydrase family protein [Thermodesulfobacteriota bacterium]